MDETLASKHAKLNQATGYEFKDADLVKLALTHASYADEATQSNERLEFLGDAILGSVVCEYLFDQFPDLLEGDLTKIKSTAVSRKTCAEFAKKRGLGELLYVGKGMQAQRKIPNSLSAAVYEAVIAAIYLDSGLESTKKFILDDMEDFIENCANSTHQNNYKSVLQHYGQQMLSQLPRYVLLDEKGPDHKKVFEVCVEISGKQYPSAWGASKKQAEQEAAMQALQQLDALVAHESGEIEILWSPDGSK